MVNNLRITLGLNDTTNVVPGTNALLLEAAAEWRKNKAAEAALAALRAGLNTDQLDYLSANDGQRRIAAAGSAAAPIGVLQELVSLVLSGYEIAAGAPAVSNLSRSCGPIRPRMYRQR